VPDRGLAHQLVRLRRVETGQAIQGDRLVVQPVAQGQLPGDHAVRAAGLVQGDGPDPGAPRGRDRGQLDPRIESAGKLEHEVRMLLQEIGAQAAEQPGGGPGQIRQGLRGRRA
jgi:hypothetical protein